MALGGLASKLTSSGSKEVKSALLCCQIFISIEQVRGNFAAMAQHMVQGLSILHDYRARPSFVAANALGPAHRGQIPALDVFIIKLFAAPCKFADPPTAIDISGTKATAYLISPHLHSAKSHNLRTIAPDMRAGLTRIATAALEFLGRVTHAESAANAARLLSEKASLLGSLESWLVDLELVLTEIEPSQPEPLSVVFLRFFHQMLKIVLLGALVSSLHLDFELRAEIDRLHRIAGNVEEGVKNYRLYSGVRNGPWQRSEVC